MTACAAGPFRLRPVGTYQAYYLHLYIAGYETVDDLEYAVQDAAERIRAGDLPDVTVPRYDTSPPKRVHRTLRSRLIW